MPDQPAPNVANGCGAEFSVVYQAPEEFGRYNPAQGFKVADTGRGDLNLRVFGYVRYLNQQATDETYTNAFGTMSEVQQRQDLQLNKAQVYFFGWLLSPKLRYVTYVWTSNTSLGQTSQVVVAGNFSYRFGDHLNLGAGINALPGVRTTDGSFPYWLSVDTRHIADEYFRPSHTTGIFADGQVVPRLDYRVMWGNNLSQFGIDAGQLDGGMDTVAAALAWTPTGDFGGSTFGDFDERDTLATRVAMHYTFSNESRQGQPDTEAFDNVQLRVSDGSIIFAPNLFAPDLQIEEAAYKMLAADAGFKFEGFSLDFEYYRRRLDHFTVRGSGVLPFDALTDNGFQVQGSAMVLPNQLQVYAGASKIYGEYGDPRDFRAGATIFPWKNQVVRWNFEIINVDRSPVGALSLPYAVGSTGTIVHSNFMLWF